MGWHTLSPLLRPLLRDGKPEQYMFSLIICLLVADFSFLSDLVSLHYSAQTIPDIGEIQNPMALRTLLGVINPKHSIAPFTVKAINQMLLRSHWNIAMI